jgi:hypothetical protein
MQYEYYETWMFQNEKTQLKEDFLDTKSVYFRFFYAPQINCLVGQRCLSGKYGDIYYINREFDDIWEYHQNYFRDFDYFNIIKLVSDRSIICKKYKWNTFIGFLVCNCDENYKPISISTFSEHSELLEYREATYAPNNTLQRDKIFIPSLWQTFEEDY